MYKKIFIIGAVLLIFLLLGIQMFHLLQKENAVVPYTPPSQ